MRAKTEGQEQSGMRRRDVLLGTTTLAVAAAAIPSAQAQTAGTQPGAQPVTAASGNKPNIIMIVSDDFGYGDAGAYLGGEARGMPTRTSIAWRKKV